MARNSLASPIEVALSKAPSFGLPESFQKPQGSAANVSYGPGEVPYQAIFSEKAKQYKLPVNVLMALAQQESSFNPTALGQPTKWGRAKGIMQYIDDTASSLGINPYDPEQAIDAAARQLRSRLDKGDSIEDAISAHFGGDNRDQWGPKTRAYGKEVLSKAQNFFDALGIKPGAEQSQNQPQAQERDWAKDYPAAQSAMENMQQSELRTQAIRTDAALDELNADEPGRYRPLTATELAQIQAQQQGSSKVKSPAVETTDAIQPQGTTIPEYMASEGEKNKSRMDGVNDYLKRFGHALGNSYDDMTRNVNNSIWLAKGGSTDEVANNIAANMKLRRDEEAGRTDGQKRLDQALRAISDANGFSNTASKSWDALKTAWDEPGAVGLGAAESAASMIPTVAGAFTGAGTGAGVGAGVGSVAGGVGAAPGAAIGAVWGGRAGMVAGTTAVEAGAELEQMVQERLQASKKEATKENIKAVLDDPAFVSDARKRATAKGLTVGMVDVLTAGLAGRVLSTPARAAEKKAVSEIMRTTGVDKQAARALLASPAGRTALEAASPGTLKKSLAHVGAFGVELLGEPVSEAASQAVARDKIDWGDVVAEGVYGAGQAVGGTAVAHGFERAKDVARNLRQPSADPSVDVDATGEAQPGADADVSAQGQPQAEAATTPPAASRDDSGLSEDAGPIERALHGAADQPTAENGQLWGGEPGTTINMQAKGMPDTAMVATVERYENDGSMTVRDESGTPYTVSPDDVDIIGAVNQQQTDSQQMQNAGSPRSEQQDSAPVDEEQAAQQQDAIREELLARGIDPETGEVASRQEETPAQRPLTDMTEEELRDRMRYLARQAKQSGWDNNLSTARREVEKVLNAKVRERENGPKTGVNGLTEVENVRLTSLMNKDRRTDAEAEEAGRLIDKSNTHLRSQNIEYEKGQGGTTEVGTAETNADTVGSGGMTLVHGSGNPALTVDDVQIIRPTGQKQGKRGRVYGGFYGTAMEDAAQAEGYAGMMGGTPTVYDVNVREGTRIFRKDGDITRLSENTINDLVSQGYGVVVGKDPRGRTEYAVIDKNAIGSITARGKRGANENTVTTEESNQLDSAALAGTQQTDNAGSVSGSTEGVAETGSTNRVRGGSVDDLSGTGSSVATDSSGQNASGAPRNALMGANNQPKWFSTAEKAQAHLDKNGITGYSVVQVRPRRFELHGEGLQSADTTAAPVSPKTPVNPRTNRAKRLVGDVGDVVSPDGDVGNLTAGLQYQITRIDKNGTIHIMNRETAGSTTITPAEMENARSRNVSWTKTDVATAVDNQQAQNTSREQQNAPQNIPESIPENQEWRSFTPNTGTLGIPRSQMPQIKAEHRGAMVNFMNARGVQHEEQTVPANTLKPTQAEYSPARVARATERTEGDRSILVSSDGYILDGHHQWLAARNAGESVKTIRLNAPIEQLIPLAREFPSSTQELSGVGQNQNLAEENNQAIENKASNEGGKTEAENSERPADYGANNKLVSQDRAAELRQRLKAKFRQLNSGIDPEILAIGTELAVFHIEASARKFADFARAMASDLDMPLDLLRPYLRSWYNGARDMMEDSGVSIQGMDSADVVRSELAALDASQANESRPEAVQPGNTPARSNTRQANTDARVTTGMDDMVSQFDSEVTNVSSPRTGLEPDRQTAGNALPVNESANVNESGPDGSGTERASQRAGEERSIGQRDQRVSGDSAVAGRESGNQRVYSENGEFRSETRNAGSDQRTGSTRDSESGSPVERNRAAAVAANVHAAGASDFAARLAAQKSAPKETKAGDVDSVRASLPMLLPEQQNDVVKVEQRHADAPGILITNGTGTGKTMSGLGVAKRMHNAGKENILILVPSDKIANDWVKSAGWLDMPLKQLSGITDNGGTGPVITTYANLGQNNELAQRSWDLIIPDESHRLMQNESGDVTDQLRMFRALTGHPEGFSTWMQAKHAEQYRALTEAQQLRDKDAQNKNDTAAAKTRSQRYDRLLAEWNTLYQNERSVWENRWSTQQNIPRVVFMSATPFAYVPNTDYAEGFLFNHTPPAEQYKDRNGGGYNSANPRDSFYIQHFGYRMRYNRLTRPGAEVNSELMEQTFNQWMKDQGALIGRSLDVPYDYDRKFILIEDAAGKKLDEALEYLNNAENGAYRNIYSAVMDSFDHTRKMFLLESMKARASIPVIKQHLALGRKVLVVHDYNQGGGFNPFAESLKGMDPDLRPVARDLFQRPQFRINFSGLESALNTLTTAFPDALTFNGTVSKTKRRAASDRFNDDATGPMVLIAQSDAMREGVSVHDTTGKHQRLELNLGLPTQPTKAIQLEGRIYRTGQASDAVFRYMTTGTAWEASAFATKLAERASTAENLALGPESRALKQSFIDAYTGAETIEASREDGKGGKAADQRQGNTISEFDKAKSFYYAQQKVTGRRDQREGADYYATAEPVGLKMVQWAGIRPGEKVLEPSAGHGAIARFFPAQSDVTMVEPSLSLSQRAALANGGARIINDTFEHLSVGNKYDAIVMNPPFGTGGKMAFDHVDKATRHLREGGRIVALVPRGGLADQRFRQFMSGAAENGIHLVADVKLPGVAFERAGTSVNSRVMVLEKNTSEGYQAPRTQNVDLSSAGNINDLFDRIEDVSVQPRQERQQRGDNLPSFRRAQSVSELGVELKNDYPGLKLSLTGSGDVVTLHRIEMPLADRNQGAGTQIMQRITDWADNNGKTVALTPSSDFGGSKARLNDFYKRFGFVANKGRQQNFEISESMYREPTGNNLAAWDRITSTRREQSEEVVSELRHVMGTIQAASADRFTDLIRRIEFQNMTATSNPQRVMAALRAAELSGEYNKQGLQLAQWLVRQYPHLANNLSMQLRRGNDESPAGNYNVTDRLVSLYSNYVNQGGQRVSGTDARTAAHEIMHHLERMMPRDVQEAITERWFDAMKAQLAEYKAAGDERRGDLLADLVAGMYGDRQGMERARQALINGELPYSDYQYASPSEFWAENAADIIAERKASADRRAARNWVDKAVDAIRFILNKIRSLVGGNTTERSELETALDSILAGDGSYQQDATILNRVGDDIYGLTDTFTGDYQSADIPQFRSGLPPEPNIPTPEQDNAKLRSWWDKAKNYPADKTTDLMQKGLAVIPMRPLVLELGRNLPAAARYMRLKQSMDAMRSRWHARTDAVAQRWLKYRKDNKTENEEMMQLMHDATIQGVDPSERFVARMTDRDRDALRTAAAGSEKEADLVRKAAEDDKRRESWTKLNLRYAALSADAKMLFSAVRDEYSALANEYEKVLMGNMEKAIDTRIKKAEREHRYEMQRITDEGLSGQEKQDAIDDANKRLNVAKTKTAWNRKARITQLRQQFETERLTGPYFPLARFGNLFVTVRDAKGKVQSFSRFEKASEQREFADLMRENQNYTVQVGTLDDTGSLRKAVDANFVADVEDILADLPNAEQVKDEVWQRYLESLPDFSIRKNRIHRTGRKGFISDALRAYGNQMFHGSHQLARLAHTFDMEESLDAAREEAQHSKDPVRDGLVVNEMERRHEFVMNPKGGPLVQRITQAAFIYALAASPKAAIVNLSQTAIMGIPILGAYDGTALGMTRAANQLTRALADFTRGKGFAQKSKSLTADERKAMQEAYDTGIIDRTQSHDLAGIGETGVEYSPARTKVMAWLAWGFHQGERLNREVTYLAAYRMARAKSLPHAEAVQKANDLTWKTHFDYQNTSRPRIMHSDTTKALLVFRNFTINMLYRLFRDIHQAAKGDTAEVRREARLQLAGTTGMMMLSAGITGTWGFGIMMMLAGMFMDDDKDPEQELKKNMIEALGPQMAGIILDGVPGYYTGTSLSDSIGMRDLWFRSPSTQLEGKDEADYWKSQLLGAAPSMVDNLVRGWGLIKEGETYRGIETAMPKAIKDPMKAYRYATEGATNKRGDVVVDNISTADVIRQALGFVPAKLAEQYDLNNAGYSLQQTVLRQRKRLMDSYWKAEEAGDEKELDKLDTQIDQYNDKFPEMEITPKSLNRSARTREQNAEEATGGMRYNRKLKDRILDEQSPTIYR